MHTYICLYRGFVLVRRGFCGGFCPRIFVWKVLSRGGFCPYPFPSQYIHYNRKLLNITFNFRCCMQEFFCMLLYPSSPVTPPRTLPPRACRTLWTAPHQITCHSWHPIL